MATIKMTDAKPSSCSKCRDYFLARADLQARVRHEVNKFGHDAGKALLNELLEGEHESHLQRSAT